MINKIEQLLDCIKTSKSDLQKVLNKYHDINCSDRYLTYCEFIPMISRLSALEDLTNEIKDGVEDLYCSEDYYKNYGEDYYDYYDYEDVYDSEHKYCDCEKDYCGDYDTTTLSDLEFMTLGDLEKLEDKAEYFERAYAEYEIEFEAHLDSILKERNIPIILYEEFLNSHFKLLPISVTEKLKGFNINVAGYIEGIPSRLLVVDDFNDEKSYVAIVNSKSRSLIEIVKTDIKEDAVRALLD